MTYIQLKLHVITHILIIPYLISMPIWTLVTFYNKLSKIGFKFF